MAHKKLLVLFFIFTVASLHSWPNEKTYDAIKDLQISSFVESLKNKESQTEQSVTIQRIELPDVHMSPEYKNVENAIQNRFYCVEISFDQKENFDFSGLQPSWKIPFRKLLSPKKLALHMIKNSNIWGPQEDESRSFFKRLKPGVNMPTVQAGVCTGIAAGGVISAACLAASLVTGGAFPLPIALAPVVITLSCAGTMFSINSGIIGFETGSHALGIKKIPTEAIEEFVKKIGEELRNSENSSCGMESREENIETIYILVNKEREKAFANDFFELTSKEN